MASEHRQIAEALSSAATTWAAANWPEAAVHVGYRLEQLNQLIGDDEPIVIGIIPTSVDDQPDRAARRHDEDLITVAVMPIGRLADLADATLEAFDAKVGQLRRHLQGVHQIDVSGVEAERFRTTLLTAFDHDQLDSKLWASLIQCEYFLDSSELAEVTA